MHLGQVSYQEAYALMLEMRQKRLKNEISDTLLFLEHPPVITMGRQSSEKDLYVSEAFLKEKNIEFFKTERGGKLTYHGPGQLVVYFIFDLAARKLSIQKFVNKVEEGLIRLCSSYNVNAERDLKNPGLWVGKNKIASVGFHIHRNVSIHGASFNINPDLKPFTYFLPCGITDKGVTSMSLETKKEIDLEKASKRLEKIYRSVYAASL